MEKVTVDGVTRALGQLYNTLASTEERQQAERWLLDLRRSPALWPIVFELLRLPMLEAKFYAATALHFKAARDWYRKKSLCSQLVAAVTEFAHGPSMVLTKLSLALAVVLLRLMLSTPTILFQVLDVLQASPSTYTAVLELVMVLPEEFHSPLLTGEHKRLLAPLLQQTVPRILAFLTAVISSTDTSEAYNREYRKRGLVALQSWVEFGLTDQYHKNFCYEFLKHFDDRDIVPLLPHIFLSFAVADLSDTAVDVLVDLISSPRNSLAFGLIESIARLRPQLRAAIDNQQDTVASNITRLAASMISTHSQTLVAHCSDPNVHQLLLVLLDATGYPGYGAVEEEVSDHTLNCWFDLENAISPILKSHPPESAERVNIENIIFPIYATLTSVLCHKCQLPADQEWASWGKEDRESFRQYREHVGETISYASTVLGLRSADVIFQGLEQALAEPVQLWQKIEGYMYALKHIAEHFDPDEDSVFFERVVAISGRVPNQTIVGHTTLLLIGNCAHWLKGHPDQLPLALNKVMQAMNDPALANAAVSAAMEICSEAAESLAPALPELLRFYVQTALGFKERRGLTKAIASVMSTLSIPQLTVHLSTFLEPSIVMLVALAEQSAALVTAGGGVLSGVDTASLRLIRVNLITAVTILQTALKFLVFENLNEANNPLLPFVQMVWPSLELILRVWAVDVEVVESVCTCVESMLRTLGSAARVFVVSFGSALLAAYKLNALPAILSTSSVLVLLFGESNPAEVSQIVLELSQAVLSLPEQEVLQHVHLAQSYFTLWSRCVKSSHATLIEQVQAALGPTIEFALRIFKSDFKPLVTAMLSFLTELFSSVNPAKRSALMQVYGDRLVKETVRAIGGGLPRSFVGLISQWLFRLHEIDALTTNALIEMALREEGFPSACATPIFKQQFLQDFGRSEYKSSARQAIDVFSNRCRNLDGM